MLVYADRSEPQNEKKVDKDVGAQRTQRRGDTARRRVGLQEGGEGEERKTVKWELRAWRLRGDPWRARQRTTTIKNRVPERKWNKHGRQIINLLIAAVPGSQMQLVGWTLWHIYHSPHGNIYPTVQNRDPTQTCLRHKHKLLGVAPDYINDGTLNDA